MKKKIYAVDFDGTLCKNAWPEIGEPNRETLKWIKTLRKNGNKVILWTCREGELLADAIIWCAEQGLLFDAVNDNIEEHKIEFGGNCRKVFADVYVDDKAVNPKYF